MAFYELNKDNFQEVINSDILVITKYYQNRCSPCNMLKPVLEKISEEATGIGFFQVNVENSPDLATSAKLTAVPVIIAYKNGKELDRLNGFHNEEVIKSFIDKNAKK